MYYLIAVIATLLSLAPINVSAALRCDVNADGKTGIEEVIYSLQVAAGEAPTSSAPTCDIDGNNKTGIEEALYALNAIPDYQLGSSTIFQCGLETDNPDTETITADQCTVIIEPDMRVDNFYTPGVINGVTIGPGDTICLRAGLRRGGNDTQSFVIKGLQGTRDNPITVTNLGGKVEIQNTEGYIFRFIDCEHIRITGTGHKDHFYGIKLASNSDQMLEIQGMGKQKKGDIYNSLTDIEIDHIELTSTNYLDDPEFFNSDYCKKTRNGHWGTPGGSCEDDGTFSGCDRCVEADNGIIVKNDPSCSNKDGDNGETGFYMDDIRLHHNYLHDIGQSFYVGYKAHKLNDNCDKSYYAHDIRNLHVYNNCVARTMKDGAQFKLATSIFSREINDPSAKDDPGIECAIHDNTIIGHSGNNYDGQKSGLLVGADSACNVYNNRISDGYGPGMEIGLYRGNVFNNIIVNSGEPHSQNLNTAIDFDKYGITDFNIERNNCGDQCEGLEQLCIDLKPLYNDITDIKNRKNFTDAGIRVLKSYYQPDTDFNQHVYFFNNTIINARYGFDTRVKTEENQDNPDKPNHLFYNNLVTSPREFLVSFYAKTCNPGTWRINNSIHRAIGESAYKLGEDIPVNGGQVTERQDYITANIAYIGVRGMDYYKDHFTFTTTVRDEYDNSKIVTHDNTGSNLFYFGLKNVGFFNISNYNFQPTYSDINNYGLNLESLLITEPIAFGERVIETESPHKPIILQLGDFNKDIFGQQRSEGKFTPGAIVQK